MTSETPEARVARARRALRAGDPLPNWTSDQWVTACVVKLGDAAVYLHREGGPAVTEINLGVGIDCFAAVAAICLDAIEAMS